MSPKIIERDKIMNRSTSLHQSEPKMRMLVEDVIFPGKGEVVDVFPWGEDSGEESESGLKDDLGRGAAEVEHCC